MSTVDVVMVALLVLIGLKGLALWYRHDLARTTPPEPDPDVVRDDANEATVDRLHAELGGRVR